jgi:hypothetical protein
MQEGRVERDDPQRGRRIALVTAAATALFASGLFAPSIALLADGRHGEIIQPHIARLAVFFLIALLTITVARDPFKPDVRVAKSLMLAGAVIAIVVGLADLVEANALPNAAVGVAPYLQIAAAALYLVARWASGLWPMTQWNLAARRMRR